MKLNEERKKLWIAALRSEKYKQGRYRLQFVDPATYCCLGILCEVAIANGVPVQKAIAGTYVTFDRQHEDIPQAVGSWLFDEPVAHAYVRLGVRNTEEFRKALRKMGVGEDSLRRCSTYEGFTQLTELNDIAHMSFTRIADVLENFEIEELHDDCRV